MKSVYAIIATILLMSAVEASAGDGKSYPGIMGVRVNESQPVPVELYAGAANPSSSQWLSMVLPILRESSNGYTKSGAVYVVDQHYDQDVCVWLSSILTTPTGATKGFWTAPKYSIGSGPQLQTISFGNLSAWVGKETVDYYYLKLPPTYNGKRSHVVSYYIDQIF